MKQVIILTLTTMLSFTCLAQTAADSAAVIKVVNAFQDDFNEGSFKQAPNYATADWVHIGPNGGFGKGRDTLMKVLREIHQGFLKGVTITIESMNINFIAPDVAIAYATHKVSTFTTPDGVKHENLRQMKSYVVVKQKGKWLLSLDHNTNIQ